MNRKVCCFEKRQIKDRDRVFDQWAYRRSNQLDCLYADTPEDKGIIIFYYEIANGFHRVLKFPPFFRLKQKGAYRQNDALSPCRFSAKIIGTRIILYRNRKCFADRWFDELLFPGIVFLFPVLLYQSVMFIASVFLSTLYILYKYTSIRCLYRSYCTTKNGITLWFRSLFLIYHHLLWQKPSLRLRTD